MVWCLFEKDALFCQVWCLFEKATKRYGRTALLHMFESCVLPALNIVVETSGGMPFHLELS